MENNKLNKFLNLVSEEKSGIHEKAAWRKANKGWLKKSANIALKILDTLREKNMSQKDLADAMGVTPQYISKVVKGQENLSLEAIDKLEKALDVELISIYSNRDSSYRSWFPIQTMHQQMLLSRNIQMIIPQNICIHIPDLDLRLTNIRNSVDFIYKENIIDIIKQPSQQSSAGENNYAMSA